MPATGAARNNGFFLALFGLSRLLELLNNDKPIVAHYRASIIFRCGILPENHLGGDFSSPTDSLISTFIRQQPSRDGNWALYPPNPYRFDTLNYFCRAANPAPPSPTTCWALTTVAATLARLLYGFRVSVLFALRRHRLAAGHPGRRGARLFWRARRF